MLCYLCNHEIQPTEPQEQHHPDKINSPDWTEPTHYTCHRRYHADKGDFDNIPEWCKGRSGYDLCITKHPEFHRMGGRARARTARRDSRGRFTS